MDEEGSFETEIDAQEIVIHGDIVTDEFTHTVPDLYGTSEVILDDLIIENDGAERVVYIVQPNVHAGELGGVSYAVVDDVVIGPDVDGVSVPSSSSDIKDNIADIHGYAAAVTLDATLASYTYNQSSVTALDAKRGVTSFVTQTQSICPSATVDVDIQHTLSRQSTEFEKVHESQSIITADIEQTIETQSIEPGEVITETGEVIKDTKEELDDYEQVNYVFCCQYCGESLTTLTELRTHLQEVHDIEEDDEYSEMDMSGEEEAEVSNLPTCLQCFGIFLTEEDLRVHSEQCKFGQLDKRIGDNSSSGLTVLNGEAISVELVDSVESVKSAAQHKCQECTMSFSIRSDLDDHVEQGHKLLNSDGTMYSKCPYCPRLYGSRWHKKSLTRHIRVAHPGLDYKEALENVEVIHIGSTDFKRQMNINTQEELVDCYDCPVCGVACLWRKNLLRHIQDCHTELVAGMEHGEIELMFEIKQRIRRTKDSLAFENKETFSCHYCEKEFMWSKSLKRHMLDSHMNKVDFDRKGVRRKKDSVETENLFSCQICPKEFMYRKTLKRHILDCHPAEVTTSMNDLMSEVMKSKTANNKAKENKENVLFKCLYCMQVSKYSCSIRTHLRRKHPEQCEGINLKRLQLPLVSADSDEFRVKSLDRRPPEEKYSDGSVVFKCPLCSYMTKNQSNLMRHLTSKVHNNIYTEEDLKKIKLSSFRITIDNEDGDEATDIESENHADNVRNRMLRIAEKKKKGSKTPTHISDENIDIVMKPSDEKERRITHKEQGKKQDSKNQSNDSNRSGDNTDLPSSESNAIKTCTVCKMEFSAYQQLIDHCGKHVNMKVSFKCQHCEYKVSHLANLKEHHDKTHTDLPFCESILSCVVTEHVDEDLPRQLKTFDCPYCDLILSKSELLNKHILLNHKNRVNTISIKAERSDEEDIVSPTFSSPGDVRNVLMGFTCMYCDCVYQTVLDIVMHMYVVHPDRDKTNCLGGEQPGKTKKGRKRRKADDDPEVDIGSTKQKSARKHDNAADVFEVLGFDDKGSANRKSLRGKYQSVSVLSTSSMSDPDTNKVTSENHCPHCEFTCKRASALNFHINFNHAKVKQEQLKVDSPKKKHIEMKSSDTESEKKRNKYVRNRQHDDKGQANVAAMEANTPINCEKKMHNHGTRASAKKKSLTENKVENDIHLLEKTNKSKSDAKPTKVLVSSEGKKINEDNASQSKSLLKTTNIVSVNIDMSTSEHSNSHTSNGIMKDVSLMDGSKSGQLVNDEAEIEDKDPDMLEDDFENLAADDDQDMDYTPAEDEEDNKSVDDDFSPIEAQGKFHVELPTALTPSRKLRCPYCDTRDFTSARFLEKHVKKTHPEKWESFSVPEAIIYSETPSPPATCTYCKRKFSSKSSVMQHVKTVHKKDVNVKLEQKTKVTKTIKFNVGNEPKKSVNFNIRVLKSGRNDKSDGSKKEMSDKRKEKVKKKENEYYKCTYCTSYFTSKHGVLKHNIMVHPEKDEIKKEDIALADASTLEDQEVCSSCPYCNFKSRWKRCVIRHVGTMHADRQDFTADLIVGEVQKNKRSKKNVPETGSFSCPYCGIINKWKKSIIRHIRSSHPDQSADVELMCLMPSESNEDSSLRSRDRRTTKKQCLLCNFTCSYMRMLKVHFDEKHPENGEVQFKYVYPKKAVVKSGDGQGFVHRCHFCNMGYHWKKSLVYHFKVHHPDMLEVFLTVDKMVDIVDSAVGPKDIKVSHQNTVCTKCGVVLSTQWAAKAHDRMKHNKRLQRSLRFKQTKCRICRVSFPSRLTLLRHKLFHHGYRRSHIKWQRMVCQYKGCNYRCKLQSSWKHHFSTVHKSEVGMQQPEQPEGESSIQDGSQLHRCEICSQAFDDEVQLSKHLSFEHMQRYSRSSKIRQFMCDACYMTFDRRSDRDKHMTQEHSERAEICDQCGSLFSSVKQLQRHLLMHGQADNHLQMCEHCGLTLTKKSVTKHYMFKHPEMLTCDCVICSLPPDKAAPIVCRLCQRSFCKKVLLQAHSRWEHGNVDKFQCKLCSQSFPTLKRRNRHIHESHRDSSVPYSCKQCPDTFPTAQTKNIHAQNVHGIQSSTENISNLDQPITNQFTNTEPMRIEEGNDPTTHIIHIGQDQGVQYLPKLSDVSLSAVIKELQIIDDKNPKYPFKCLLCGRNFAKSKYIKLHIRRNHVKDEDQPYRCKVCGSGFVRLTEFRKHSRSHSGFRPYKCKICPKAFKQQANLQEHMNVHKDTKDFECAICKRCFRQRGAMNSHIPFHDKLKPFKCMFCSKGYTTRGELSRHLQRYDGDGSITRQGRSFLCHICEETFTHFPMLLRHIEQHNPDKPFHCQACPMKFASFISMYNHKLKVGHFLISEIEDEVDANEKSVRKVRNMSRDNRRAVQGLQLTNHRTYAEEQLDDSLSVHDTIFSSQSEGLNDDQSKIIEVVIESVGSDEIVYASNGRNDNEELLSIAKQLTELSTYTEVNTTATMFREEDEIIKGMLDADSDLLANIGKPNNSQKWTASDTWEQEETNSNIADDKPKVVMHKNNADSSMQISDTTETSTHSIPSNMTELASLIAQNSDIATSEGITAYQSMDGSVIYVCMAPEQVVEHTEDIYESNQPVQTEIIKDDVNEYKMQADEDMEMTQDRTEIVESNDTVIQETETMESELITIAAGVAENVELVEQDTENVHETEHLHEAHGIVEEYDDGMATIVEYENDEKTFIKEELLDSAYTGLEQAGNITIRSQSFKYLFNIVNKVFKCVECGQQHKTIRYLREHLKRHMPEEERDFECKYCNKRFVTTSELNCHNRKHTGERPYKCNFCDKRFIQAGHLQDHLKIHSGLKPYKCKDCDRCFTTKSLMTAHWKRHHSKQKDKLVCGDCKRTFSDDASLKTHIGFKHSGVFGPPKEKTRKTGDKEYQCHICGDLLDKQSSYYEHMRKHQEGSPKLRWVCEVCGEAFKLQRCLVEHILKQHSDEMPEVCEFCGNAYKLKRDLHAHLKKKHGPAYEKRTGKKAQFPCHVCGRVFACKAALAYHGGASESCKLGLLSASKQ